MRLPNTRFLGKALPTTIGAGAVALLLSVSARPVAAQISAEPDGNGHLEALLARHDVRYVLQTAEDGLADCPLASVPSQISIAPAHEATVGTAPAVIADKQAMQEHAR